MIQLLQPGIYSLPEDNYHADPCPAPSLSGSIAIPLVHQSPLHAWFAHPRLNPKFERQESKRLDLGSAAHRLVLGAGADIEVIDAEDYKKQAARDARDAAYAAGKIPLLPAQHDQALAMAAEAKHFMAPLLSVGKPEQVMVWQEGNAWCRGMVDWLQDDRRLVVDYKTTGTSAQPEDVSKTIFNMHYHMKAAFYERGLNVLDPAGIGRRRFLFLFQEIEPPYACSMHELSEAAMTIGRKQMTYAVRLWQRCMAENKWPGYPYLTHQSPPHWVERGWLDREMNDPFATGETSPDGGPVRHEAPKSLVATGD